MFSGNNLSPAQFVDRFMTRTALGIFLVSLAYGASVFERLLEGETVAILDKLGLALGIGAIVIVLPQFISLIKRRKSLELGSGEPEGFVTDVYKRAAERAFALTFVFLLFMDIMTGRTLSGLSAEVAIKIVIAVSLAIFSISFYLFNRVDDEDLDEFEDETRP